MTSKAITKYNDTLTGAPVELSEEIVLKYINSKATQQECYLFIQLCKSQGLNPFVRDAHLIKYSKDEPARMVTGKEAFTKRAEAHRHFAGMEAGVIVVKGDSEPIERVGTLVLADRGETIVGSWAKVYRTDRNIPFYQTFNFNEFSANSPLWKKMPGVMIRKVALVSVLREAFPNSFAGMYDSAEMDVDLGDDKQTVEEQRDVGTPRIIEADSPAPTAPEDEEQVRIDNEDFASDDEEPPLICDEHKVPCSPRKGTTGAIKLCHEILDENGVRISWCVPEVFSAVINLEEAEAA